jgi:hypothetical protein
MDEKNMPNPSPNKPEAEDDRWESNPNTVGQKDRESQGTRDRTPGSSEATGGVTNRPLEEEEENQAAVPDRGESREGTQTGRTDKDRSQR